MKKTPKIKFIIIPLLFMPVFWGCIPETKKVIVGPKTDVITPTPLPLHTLDQKISYLSTVLEGDSLNDKDREIALNLLSAYKTIRSAPQDHSGNYDYQKIIHILFNNLSQLDQSFFLKESLDDQQYPKVINQFSLKRKKIFDDYVYGDYQGVINGCLELEASFGPNALSPETSLLLALSLARKGFIEEAVSIGEKIVRELEGKPDLISLRAGIVEWQLDLENGEKALQVYEKLMDNIDEKEAIFKNAEKAVTDKKEKVTVKRKVSSDMTSIIEMNIEDPGPLGQLLKEVDELVKRQEFQKARLLLIRHRISLEEGPELETIDQALKTLKLAEESFQQKKETETSNENESITLARKLIEEENFEDAIAKLEELSDDQDMAFETKELKDLAIEKLINQKRNKAAKLFLMAKNTNDPKKKEELLVSSYNMLQVLIEKYPSSTLIDKLNNHIKNVKKELIKLGVEP